MTEEKKQYTATIPAAGIWTIQDLAAYMDITPGDLQQKLTDMGIKVLPIGKKYTHRLVRLEDLRVKEEA